MAERRVILWDLMDTLVRDPFYTHVPRFFGMTFDELLAAKHPTAWGQFELGRIDESTLFERFFRDEREFDGPGLKRCMIENTHWLPGMHALVGELASRRVEMHLLSNYSRWYEEYVARLGIVRLVQPTFVSCKTGVRKPAERAYVNAFQQLGVAPDQCFFVDDREKNCDAARLTGMAAFHFTGNVGRLRQALIARGFPLSKTS